MENKRTETNKTVQKRLEPELKLINMDTVEVEQIEWLLYPFIPYGKVTIIQGDPGEGKTTMVLQIIAKLTRGETILPADSTKDKRIDIDSESDMVDAENIENNASTQHLEAPVNVIYQTAEDGLGDTIKPRLLQEVAWIGKDLEKLSSQILSTCNRAKVAIIMDWENWWALSDAQAISRKFDYTEELLKYYRVFWEKGIEVDIISMDRELLDYQLVVAPTLYLYKKEYIHKVEAYVEAGGIYVTTYWSGVVDETDLCFIGERPHERLLGLSVDEIDVGNEYFPNTFSYKDGVYKAGVLREVVTLQTAKPLGTYLQDYNVNTPAITENAYGKGKAYYVAVQPDLEFLKEFLGDVIEEANVEANLTETLPYGVTVSKRSGKEQKDDVYFLQNFNRHPVKMVLNECYTNLITDEILTGSVILQTYQCIVMQKK